jgi:hypothetical protein
LELAAGGSHSHDSKLEGRVGLRFSRAGEGQGMRRKNRLACLLENGDCGSGKKANYKFGNFKFEIGFRKGVERRGEDGRMSKNWARNVFFFNLSKTNP